jgi:hypothetical protein
MVVVCLLSVTAVPPEAHAAADCQIGCTVVFGLTSFTVATGTAVGWGRITGGIATQGLGQAIWATGFGLSLGAGLVQWGAPSHERMIFSAGVGSAAGALLGVALESAVGRGEGSGKVAAALMGAALGAIAGGVYGALSHEEGGGAAGLLSTRPPPVFGIRIPF